MPYQSSRQIDLSAIFPIGGNIEHPKSKVVLHKVPGTNQRIELTLFNANTQKGDPLGPVKRVVFHWTAGSSRGIWDDYHICFVRDVDGELYAIRCVRKGMKGQHLYRRNTGSYGLSFAAPGPEGITEDMIEMAAKYAAEVCHKYGLDPSGKTDEGFLVIDDHAAYAAVDYPGQRWDIGGQLPKTDKRNILDRVRKKAIWYFGKIPRDLKSGNALYEFADIL